MILPLSTIRRRREPIRSHTTRTTVEKLWRASHAGRISRGVREDVSLSLERCCKNKVALTVHGLSATRGDRPVETNVGGRLAGSHLIAGRR
jgi:hypothetical protein